MWMSFVCKFNFFYCSKCRQATQSV